MLQRASVRDVTVTGAGCVAHKSADRTTLCKYHTTLQVLGAVPLHYKLYLFYKANIITVHTVVLFSGILIISVNKQEEHRNKNGG